MPLSIWIHTVVGFKECNSLNTFFFSLRSFIFWPESGLCASNCKRLKLPFFRLYAEIKDTTELWGPLYQRAQALREAETSQLACHRDNSFVGTVVQLPFELITQVKCALFSVSIFIENPRIFIWHYKQFDVERLPLEGIQSSNKTVTWFLWKTFYICLQNTLDDRIKSTVL